MTGSGRDAGYLARVTDDAQGVTVPENDTSLHPRCSAATRPRSRPRRQPVSGSCCIRVAIFYKAAFYDRKAFMHLIDVGSHYADEAIYGDGPVSGPWAKLTDAERADALVRVGEYLADAEQYPDIYGKRVDRAQAVLAQIDALAGEVPER